MTTREAYGLFLHVSRYHTTTFAKDVVIFSLRTIKGVPGSLDGRSWCFFVRVRVSHKKAPGPAVQASRHSFDGSQRKYYHIFRKRGGMVPRYVQKEAIGFPCRHQHFMLQYA